MLCSSFPFRFVSPTASRFSLTLWQPSLHAVCRESEYQDVTTRVASPCQRIPGSTWNNSTLIARTVADARGRHGTPACFRRECRAGGERSRRDAKNSQHTSTERRRDQAASIAVDTRHWRREERGLDRGPIVGAVTQDNQPTWANTNNLEQSTWTFRFDLSLKTDGQTNTWHSEKDTILTVCHGQTNTCHSSGQIDIGLNEKKKMTHLCFRRGGARICPAACPRCMCLLGHILKPVLKPVLHPVLWDTCCLSCMSCPPSVLSGLQLTPPHEVQK